MVSRTDKKLVSEAVADLSQRARIKQLEVSEIDQWRQYLSKMQFSSSSSFYTDLDALESYVKGQNKRDFFHQIETYQGRVNGKPIRIRRAFNHLFFSRTYHNMDFHINYRLNVGGKIDFVELKVFRDPYNENQQFLVKNKHLIHVENHEKQVINGNMLRNRVNLHTFPTFMGLVNGQAKEQDFWDLCTQAKYQSLLRYGYGGIKETLDTLDRRDGGIDDDIGERDMKKGILPLSAVLRDEATMHILEETAYFLPDLRTRDGKSAQIFYYPAHNGNGH